MSIVRYSAVPEQRQAGEWYSVDGAAGAVQVLRGAVADLGAAGLTDVWRGETVLARGTPGQGRFVYHLRFPVPPADTAEFVAWYTEEHLPLLLTEPTWYAGELLRMTEPGPYSFAALHCLESRATLQSPVLAGSRQTEGWLRLARHTWFDKPFLRMHLHRL